MRPAPHRMAPAAHLIMLGRSYAADHVSSEAKWRAQLDLMVRHGDLQRLTSKRASNQPGMQNASSSLGGKEAGILHPTIPRRSLTVAFSVAAAVGRPSGKLAPGIVHQGNNSALMDNPRGKLSTGATDRSSH